MPPTVSSPVQQPQQEPQQPQPKVDADPPAHEVLIKEQLARLDAGLQAEDAVVAAIPSLDKAAALRGWPCPEHLDRDARGRRVHSYVAYRVAIKRLRGDVRARKEAREAEEARARAARFTDFHRARADPALWLRMLDAPPQRAVLEPAAMPVDVPPVEEFRSIMCHLSSRRGRPAQGLAQFQRGALYDDGRVDMCKQVLGPDWIARFVHSVEQDGGAAVQHFLMGNNVVGRRGADAIADYVERARPSIETWYLAGNSFDAGAAGRLCAALKDDPNVRALWLKRNPLGVEGARHVADMLRGSNRIEVLDLHNTALGDEGVRLVMEALEENTSLRVLYVDANAVGPAGAEHVRKYLASGKARLTHLYACMNPLGDEGAAAVARGLAEYDGLETLALSSCRFGPVGLHAVCAAAAPSRRLRALIVGHYKATADMGELPNSFGLYGARTLANFVRRNRSVRVLDFSITHVPEAGVAEVARAVRDANADGASVGWVQAAQYGYAMSGETRALLTAVRTIKDQEKRLLCHTPRVVHIDSIYRNAM